MNKLVVLFITAIIALCLTGCWGTAIETVNTDNTNTNKTVADFANADTDTNEVNNQTANSQNTDRPAMLDIQSNKVGNHVRSGKPGEDIPEMKRAAKTGQTIPAPENSVISNEMNKQGNPVQTRKFNGNPTIDKLEIIALGEKQNKQLLYLKNGRVLEMPDGAVENPMSATSYTLLKAVGIEIKTPGQPNIEKKQ